MFFFDESRFGTRSQIGYGWFERGSRPNVSIKLGFENFYVYGAVEPVQGSSFSLILPYVNSEGMNVFFEQFVKELQGEEIVLVMDGAGWHKSSHLIIPPNIEIVYLPAYSPELNPIERLWLYIKQLVLRNRIYDNLDFLEHAVCECIKSILPLRIQTLCCAKYLFS